MYRLKVTAVVRQTPALLSTLLLMLAAAPPDQLAGSKTESLLAKQQPLFVRLDVQDAWAITKGDPKVLVGVIDNGFDFFHPDLKGQVTPGFYFSGGYHGEFYENLAHGTMVASIIVAADRKNSGMVGLAPRCRVLTASQGTLEHAILKLQRNFFQNNPKASLADWQKEMSRHSVELKKFGEDWVRYQFVGSAEAIRYLVDRGVRVINISGGMWKSACPATEAWSALEDAFAYAAVKNVLILLGSGNDAAERDDYPGNARSVIVVGAAKLDDSRWEQVFETGGGKITQGSSYGKRLTVMAPSENIVVCQPHDARFYICDDGPTGPFKMEFKGPHMTRPSGGTSCATAVVTSLVALVYSVRPDLGANSVVEIVKQGCDDIGNRGHDIRTGFGRVNFGKTIKLARDWTN
jgi:thermitase